MAVPLEQGEGCVTNDPRARCGRAGPWRRVESFWHRWKVIRGALIFTGFYLSGAFFGWLVLPLVSLFVRDPLKRVRTNQRAVSWGFRLTLDWLRWCRIFTFNSRKVDPQLPEGPVIIVSNHPTTIDVVAVLSVYSEASVVVKHKIWTDPLLRRLFRWCGHIDGGDGSMESNVALLAQVEERLRQGFPVVIFPEGTRSPVRGLGPMFKGAFAVATTTRTNVLPVLITCNPPALHKEAPWHALPDHPVTYKLEPQRLITVSNTSARKLQRQIVELYCNALGLSAAPILAAEAKAQAFGDSVRV
jgi:1-acyl-sn-glycerol-3-phosphate acyltransferase